MQQDEAADDALNEANAFAVGALDWLVDDWSGFELRLVGGNTPDAPWGRAAEMVFSDASYVRCPAQMFEAVFRLGAPHEVPAVIALEPNDRVFVIEASASGTPRREPFLVIAKHVAFRAAPVQPP